MRIWYLAFPLMQLAGCSAPGETVTRDCAPDSTKACTCTDGSGGSQRCSSSGYWTACFCGTCPVTPSCAGKACGADDGCGTACLVGSCPTAGEKCVAGICKAGPCEPDCTGKSCGDPDLCGDICRSSPCPKPGYICNAGTCECKPVCTTCGGDDTCGGKCSTGACDKGYRCSSGSCTVDPTSKWVVTVKSGTLPLDKNWNSLSKPDPMVCLWISGSRLCTQEATDTLSPSWSCTLPPIAASALMAGIDIETFDNDRSGTGTCGETISSAPGDAICSRGSVSIAAADFKSGTWGAGCSNMSFNATLSPF